MSVCRSDAEPYRVLVVTATAGFRDAVYGALENQRLTNAIESDPDGPETDDPGSDGHTGYELLVSPTAAAAAEEVSRATRAQRPIALLIVDHHGSAQPDQMLAPIRRCSPDLPAIVYVDRDATVDPESTLHDPSRVPVMVLHRPVEARALEQLAAMISVISRTNSALGARLHRLEDQVRQREATLVERNRLIEYRATHDEVTGLANRRELEARLGRALERARESGVESVLCYLDLDQFSVANETRGHAGGNELLRQVGGRLRRAVSNGDTVARLGGDEFAVLLTAYPMESATEAASLLRDAVREAPFFCADSCFHFSTCTGIVSISRASGNVADVLDLAAKACAIAKSGGPSRIHVCRDDDELVSRRETELGWLARLDEALASDSIELHGQVIAPLSPGLAGNCEHRMEVLLRIADEHGNPASAADFISVAERYGLAPAVDRLVIERSLRYLSTRSNQANRIDVLSVNVSGQSIANDEFRGHLDALLTRYPEAARRVCFEITETAVVSNFERTAEWMRKLRRRGCRFALDDFGSGLCSFGYLKNLPVDVLKIDGQFIMTLDEDPVCRAVVRAVNELAHALGHTTVAECVERPEILEALRSLGVDYAQGHLLGRPARLRSEQASVPTRDAQRDANGLGMSLPMRMTPAMVI